MYSFNVKKSLNENRLIESKKHNDKKSTAYKGILYLVLFLFGDIKR